MGIGQRTGPQSMQFGNRGSLSRNELKTAHRTQYPRLIDVIIKSLPVQQRKMDCLLADERVRNSPKSVIGVVYIEKYSVCR